MTPSPARRAFAAVSLTLVLAAGCSSDDILEEAADNSAESSAGTDDGDTGGATTAGLTDPNTGEEAATSEATGQPFTLDPITGESQALDPVTGKILIEPNSGAPVVVDTGSGALSFTDPATGESTPIDNSGGVVVNDPATNAIVPSAPNTTGGTTTGGGTTGDGTSDSADPVGTAAPGTEPTDTTQTATDGSQPVETIPPTTVSPVPTTAYVPQVDTIPPSEGGLGTFEAVALEQPAVAILVASRTSDLDGDGSDDGAIVVTREDGSGMEVWAVLDTPAEGPKPAYSYNLGPERAVSDFSTAGSTVTIVLGDQTVALDATSTGWVLAN